MSSILIVDDEEGLLESLTAAFLTQGYRVAGARSAEAALERLAGTPFDVLLTDLVMPGTDGLGLLEQVRERCPAMVVILMTAGATVESAVQALKGGAYDYVVKPFTLPAIFHVVARGLEQQRLRQENLQLSDLNRRLRELDQVKLNLLSAVSHEFRTPLTIMQGWLDLLLAGQCGAVAPVQQESLAAIRLSAIRLERLIANLLAFIQCERGEGIRARLAVDPGALLRAVATELTPECAARGLTLSLAIPTSLPPMQGDGERLRLAFFNLLENAVKFNEPGGAVRIEVREEEGGLTVGVTNTRGEVPAARVPHLFLPFSQGDMGPARPAGGLGLGLALVRAIVEAHGGALSLETGHGDGTSVFVRLPAARTDGANDK